MASDHYVAFVKEAFIDPIRSVLIVDDDFPTYDEVLTTARRSGKPALRHRNKAWHGQPDRVAGLIAAFRKRPRPLLVDIHDGANVPGRKADATVAHLHQCDLLVLDYELDRDKHRDGSRAIGILRALMSNDHFNLVVIYTVEDLDFVYDAVRWGLISPSDDLLSDDDVGAATDLIAYAGDSIEHFAVQLRDSIGSAQYFHSRQYKKSFLGTMMKGQQPYTQYHDQTDRTDWTPKQRKLVLQYLLEELEQAKGLSENAKGRSADLEWSTRGLRWIKSDSAFIAFSNKTDNTDDLLSDLQRALVSWNPRPSRLFLTKLRAEIDEHGIAAQGPALRHHHALAYWYHRLLVDSSDDDRRWRIAESISRHSSELLKGIQPRVERFASRLVQEEMASGDPLVITKDHFGVDLSKKKQKTCAVIEHNVFVCSMEPTGWHLTTGHVFSMSDEHWICLSPACDLVPSQMPSWQVRRFGRRLPFLGVRLYEQSTSNVPSDVHTNRYLYIRTSEAVACFSFNEKKNIQSAPRWQVLFAENQGRFTGRNFRFKVASVGQGKNRLVSKSLPAHVIGQLRYEYALNLVQKLGVSLTRIGLDFAADPEGEA